MTLKAEPVAWYHVPYPNSGISPMVSLSQQHEPSMYGAVVPLYLAPPIMEPEIKVDKEAPVAWLFTNVQSGESDFCYCEDEHDHDREMWHRQPLYLAPPQRPAEPEQEPVAKVELMMTGGNAGLATRIVEIDDHLRERLRPGQLLYTTPPTRKPLTEEEILKAIGWDRAEMYMKLTPNFPVAEAKKETLKNARAIERAHGIGGEHD